MKTRSSYYFVLVLWLLFFVSCKKENLGDCFKGNGAERTEIRTPGAFDNIYIKDKFDVEIFQGATYKVEISAGKNVMGNIKTRVEGRTLIVENNNKCNFVRGYKRQIKIKISLPKLSYLENIGVGVSRVDPGFVQDSISVRVSSSGDVHVGGSFHFLKTSSNGNGDMYVSGKTDRLYVYTNGINFVNTEELLVKDYMFIHSVTIGDCTVNASGCKKFDYNIQKDGNIYYIGEPVAFQDFSDVVANGRLLKKE